MTIIYFTLLLLFIYAQPFIKLLFAIIIDLIHMMVSAYPAKGILSIIIITTFLSKNNNNQFNKGDSNYATPNKSMPTNKKWLIND